jgi:hypothetical protein
LFKKALEYAGAYRKTTCAVIAAMFAGLVASVTPFLLGLPDHKAALDEGTGSLRHGGGNNSRHRGARSTVRHTGQI